MMVDGSFSTQSTDKLKMAHKYFGDLFNLLYLCTLPLIKSKLSRLNVFNTICHQETQNVRKKTIKDIIQDNTTI